MSKKSKNVIVIAVKVENEMLDQYELSIAGQTVFITREQMHDAIELGLEAQENYDININTMSVFADVGGEEDY
jgi:hypothetical protein